MFCLQYRLKQIISFWRINDVLMCKHDVRKKRQDHLGKIIMISKYHRLASKHTHTKILLSSNNKRTMISSDEMLLITKCTLKRSMLGHDEVYYIETTLNDSLSHLCTICSAYEHKKLSR